MSSDELAVEAHGGLLMTPVPTANQPTNNDIGPTLSSVSDAKPKKRDLVQSKIASYVPTDDVPTVYVSIRVTTPHSNWRAVEKLLEGAEYYISYPHSGKEGNNEHFHVLVSGGTNADREKYRKRFKAAGFIGNKFVSVKLCQNGITSAITYCAKESTQPYVLGELCESWIRQSPAWVEQRAAVKRKGEDYVELNCKNLMRLAFDYRKSTGVKSTDLAQVIEFMLNSGHYIMAPTLMRQGAPSWMLDVFKHSCDLGELKWTFSYWKEGVFRDFSGR